VCQNLKPIGEEVSKIVWCSTTSQPHIDFTRTCTDARIGMQRCVKIWKQSVKNFRSCVHSHNGRLHFYLYRRWTCVVYIRKVLRGKWNVIKSNVEKLWGARYLLKNTVIQSFRYDALMTVTLPEFKYVKFITISYLCTTTVTQAIIFSLGLMQDIKTNTGTIWSSVTTTQTK
jgi:hypothetical protein